VSANEALEEILREIKQRRLKPKQIIENYGEETLKQIIIHLNRHYRCTVTDIVAYLNLTSIAYFRELLRKLGIQLEKTWGYYTKPLPHSKTQQLLRKAKTDQKIQQTIQYIKQHNKPPPWFHKLSEEQKTATILWLNHREKQSLRKIGKILREHPTKLSLLLKKHGTQPKKPYRKPIINPQDKAYLVGLRTGDLTVRMNGGSLVAQVGTTHYTAWHQIFQKLFTKYTSTFYEVPRYRPNKKPPYEWTIIATLHPQDKWILNQPKDKVPEWVKQSKELFLAYLAGYTDSEGTWYPLVHYGRKRKKGDRRKYYYITFSAANNDKQLLEDIKKAMEELLSIHGYITIAHKEGETGRLSKKPGYKLVTTGKNAVKLAKLLLPYLKHPDRAERAKLAVKHGSRYLTQEQLQEWRNRRQKEKQQVKKDIELARKIYQQKHKNPKQQNQHQHLFLTLIILITMFHVSR